MDDASELKERLFVAAGIIMEDTAPEAIFHLSSMTSSERLASITVAGRDIQVLAMAAAIISRRWG